MLAFGVTKDSVALVLPSRADTAETAQLVGRTGAKENCLRILLLINMYPPLSDGGYPLECQEVVDELRGRGHSVLVLTSTNGRSSRAITPDGVWRVLDYCPKNEHNKLPGADILSLLRWFWKELVEHTFLQRALRQFKPEVVYVWATKGMSYSLAIRLAHQNVPFLAHVSGYWLVDHNRAAQSARQYTFWNWVGRRGWVTSLKRLFRHLLASRVPVDFEPLIFDRVAFTSRKIEAEHTAVQVSFTDPVRIYPGVPVKRFLDLPLPNLDRPRKILFVGRLHPTKDPLTLIRACAALQARPETADVFLSLVGWRHDLAYVDRVEDAIRQAPRPDNIRLFDPIPFGEMPALFAANHILVLPSLVEPFGRVAAEAAAAGLVDIVSDNTGFSECIVEDEHALVFQAGDVSSLTRCLERVLLDPNLARRLQWEGKARASTFFSTSRMVDEIEAFVTSSCLPPIGGSRFGKVSNFRESGTIPLHAHDNG